jgi:hypothetical protein
MPSELSERDRRWWARDEPDVELDTAHRKLWAVCEHIRRTQDYRKKSYLLHGAMYGGSVMQGTALDTYQRTTPRKNTQLSLNVTRNVVDSVVSRVASKAKPKLSYVPNGADYEKQKAAEELEQGVDGVFYKTGMYDYTVAGFRDATVFGIGQTRIEEDEDEGEVRVDRYMPWEKYCDDGEARYGAPRCHYVERYVDKDALAWRFRADEEKARLIRALSVDRDEDADYGYQQIALRVRYREAWHLPSGKGALDGRHVVGVQNCTLVDEPWDPRDWGPLPFASVIWSPSIVGTDPRGGGFPGQGIVDLGAGIQQEINKLVRQIQNGHHLVTGHWLVDVNSSVIASHINNDLSTILKYTGKEPIYNAPTIISPEMYEHLWNLVARYYALAGVNEQTASAQKPAGLDSGEAQRVYADQQTETLLEKGARYEEYVRQCGALVTHAAKRLAKGGAYEVRALSDDAYSTIDWSKLDDPDGYELQVQPTSSLPGTISGRLSTAQDMLKLGVFDAADILEITGTADLFSLESRKQASRKLVEKVVDEMLREGTPYAPTSMLNADEAIVVATQLHNVAEIKGVSQDRLQLVRDFVAACKDLQKLASAPAPQQAGPSGAILGPGAGPVALPVAGGPAPAASPGPAPPAQPVPAAA